MTYIYHTFYFSPHPASLPSPVGSASGREGSSNQIESSRSSSRIDQNLELQKKSMRHSEVLNWVS